MTIPTRIKLVEVSPRDGLQNEAITVPTNIKIEFINRLSDTGLRVIEVTSFVSPKWIPQLADHSEVFQGINKHSHIAYPVMVFNQRGLDDAVLCGVKEIAVFTTPSEEFCKRNANCSVKESLQRIADMNALAKKQNILVRGYISCVLGCPFEGEISPEKVADLTEQLMESGCYEVSLGDTIGVGTPGKTAKLIKTVTRNMAFDNIAVHFHDTYGQALANIYAAILQGIGIIDSSVAGLGGCPYAKGASGNVATEDVLYMLNGLGIDTGIDLDKLIETGYFITQYLGRENRSKVALAKMSH